MKHERMKIVTDILAIDSTNGNEAAVADYLAHALRQVGIESKQVVYSKGRASLVAEFGQEGKVLGISGHMDVVSAGNSEEWTTPPFEPTIRNGSIYARGASDMKSGLAAMVCAMMELKAEGFSPAGRVRLLATVGEEIGLLGAKQLTDEGYLQDVESLIIGEPTGHRIGYAHKGVVTYTVTSHGKSAHSSMPELGVNAIDNLLVFYNEMMKQFKAIDRKNDELGAFVYNNSIIAGGEQTNSVPEVATLKANLRTIPEVNSDQVIELLEAIIQNLNDTYEAMDLQLEINQCSHPVFSSRESKIVRITKEEAEQQFGEAVPLLTIPGGTDASEFIRGNEAMQIIIFGPGNESIHQTDENVAIDNYLEMVDLYKKIIIRYFE